MRKRTLMTALISSLFSIDSYAQSMPVSIKKDTAPSYFTGGYGITKGKRHKSLRSRSNRRKAKAKR